MVLLGIRVYSLPLHDSARSPHAQCFDPFLESVGGGANPQAEFGGPLAVQACRVMEYDDA